MSSSRISFLQFPDRAAGRHGRRGTSHLQETTHIWEGFTWVYRVSWQFHAEQNSASFVDKLNRNESSSSEVDKGQLPLHIGFEGGKKMVLMNNVLVQLLSSRKASQ